MGNLLKTLIKFLGVAEAGVIIQGWRRSSNGDEQRLHRVSGKRSIIPFLNRLKIRAEWDGGELVAKRKIFSDKGCKAWVDGKRQAAADVDVGVVVTIGSGARFRYRVECQPLEEFPEYREVYVFESAIVPGLAEVL